MAVNRLPANPKKLRPYDRPRTVRRPLVPNGVDNAAIGYLVMGIVWLATSLGIGALWGGLRLVPDLAFGMDIPFLPIGSTLRFEVSVATAADGFWNTLVFGWLGNALLGATLFIVPRLSGKRLAFEALAVLSVVAWNLAVLVGFTAVYLPAFKAPAFLAEFPAPIDGLLAAAVFLVCVAVFRTLLATPREVPYVGVAFQSLGLLALLGAVSLGAVVDAAALFLDLAPTPQALLYGVYGQMLTGLGLGGLAIGAVFYVIPRASGNPLWSAGLGWLAWLLWAALAGLALFARLADTSIPYLITLAGDAGTLMLLAPMLLIAANLVLTLSGRWTLLLTPGAATLALIGVGFLVAGALLSAIGALSAVQQLLRGTQWGLGVLTWSLAGAGSFAALAVTAHALPRLLRREWRDSLLQNVVLYALFAGLAWAGFTFIVGGVTEGSLRAGAVPPEEMRNSLVWYALATAAGLGLAALGGLVAALDLFLLYTTGRPASYVVPRDAAPSVAGETVAASAAGAGQ